MRLSEILKEGFSVLKEREEAEKRAVIKAYEAKYCDKHKGFVRKAVKELDPDKTIYTFCFNVPKAVSLHDAFLHPTLYFYQRV